jgi:hypothetical protein
MQKAPKSKVNLLWMLASLIGITLNGTKSDNDLPEL